MRGIVRTIHLYLGLSLGALFVLSGLTGSVLVFYPQIDDWLSPEVHAAASNARPRSYEALYQTLLRAHPERSSYWRIEVPEHGGPVQSRSLSDEDRAGTRFAPLIVWVDPRDNRVLRSARWGQYFGTFVYDFHYRLWLGRTGAAVMGVVGLMVIGLLATGVWSWWPVAWRFVPAALRWREAQPLQAQLYNVHKLAGIYGGAALLLIAATGVMISLPDQVKPLLSLASRPYAAPRLTSNPQAGKARISVDEAVAIASARLPQGGLKWIETPTSARGVYTIRFRQRGEPTMRFPNSTVWIEPYTGQVLGVRDAARDARATSFVDWEHPLHTGEALGLPGKWLALLLGLLPLALFVTGFWRWRLGRGRT